MDPNENIKEQLALTKKIIDAESFGDEVDDEDARRLAELVEAMDEWLSAGGFLPERWVGP